MATMARNRAGPGGSPVTVTVTTRDGQTPLRVTLMRSNTGGSDMERMIQLQTLMDVGTP